MSAYVNNMFDTDPKLSLDRERGLRARLGYNIGTAADDRPDLRQSFGGLRRAAAATAAASAAAAGDADLPGWIGDRRDGDLPGSAAATRLRRRHRRRRPSAADASAMLNVTRRSLLIGAGGAAVSPLSAKPMQAAWRRTCRRDRRRRVRRLDRASPAGAGPSVTLIDAWGPAHSRASSGGESRLTRAAYGKDAIYTRMAMDSLPQWKALSAVSGLPIFIPAGILFFFPTEEPYVHDSIAAHKKFGLPTDVLTQAEMAKRFPMIDFDGNPHRALRARVRRADGAALGADAGRPLRRSGRDLHEGRSAAADRKAATS